MLIYNLLFAHIHNFKFHSHSLCKTKHDFETLELVGAHILQRICADCRCFVNPKKFCTVFIERPSFRNRFLIPESEIQAIFKLVICWDAQKLLKKILCLVRM